MQSVSDKSIREHFLARSEDGRVSLSGVATDDTGGLKEKRALKEIKGMRDELLDLQERLFAEKKQSILLVLQGMDTSGKDGTVKHVLFGFNPQGVHIRGFKAPSPEELRHDFLWRFRKEVPNPGHITIFNRSHYEDVLVARVKTLAEPQVIDGRYSKINRFEAQVAKSGVRIIKICLHISYDEQRRRLLARLHDDTKRWKFSANDINERRHWDDYWSAYDEALTRCSTPTAPWYLVPSDEKWYRNWVISHILLETLREMNPKYPMPRLNIVDLTRRLSPIAPALATPPTAEDRKRASAAGKQKAGKEKAGKRKGDRKKAAGATG